MSSAEVKKDKVLPFYQNAGPFNIAGVFSLEAFKSALEYKPRSDDLFIVTYPKCGTTWMQYIVGCIFRNGQPFSNALEYFSCTPFLEASGVEAAYTMKRPGAIKLHLPFNLTPYSPEAKYIFVARNPKDCCVSFYNHTKMPMYNFQNGTFDDYFELFMDGKVDFGNYFDTLLSWYEHRNDSNVLFLTYEDMKGDIEKAVLKVAEFMGQQYKEALLSNPQMLKDVIYHSSIEFMKKFFNNNLEEIEKMPRELLLNHPDVPAGIKQMFRGSQSPFTGGGDAHFVRKGIVGDWRNYFSEEQSRRMDAMFYDRTKGTDLQHFWKTEMAL